MATVSVLYPQGVKFDMDYYLTKHMPLVQKEWGPLGLKSWTITEMPDDAPYKVSAVLTWGSVEEIESATKGPTAKTVFGDVHNFADKQPTHFRGPIVKSG